MKINTFGEIPSLLFEFNAAVAGTVSHTAGKLNSITSLAGSEHPVVLTVDDPTYRYGEKNVGNSPAISNTTDATDRLQNTTPFPVNIGNPVSMFVAAQNNNHDNYHYFSTSGPEFGITASGAKRYLRANGTVHNAELDWYQLFEDQFHTVGMTTSGGSTYNYYENGRPRLKGLAGGNCNFNTIFWLHRIIGPQSLRGASSVLVGYRRQVSDEEAQAIHDLMWFWQEMAAPPTDPLPPVHLPVPDKVMAAGETLQVDLNPFLYNDATPAGYTVNGATPAGVTVSNGVVTVGASVSAGTHDIVIDATSSNGTKSVSFRCAVSSMSLKDPVFPYV